MNTAKKLKIGEAIRRQRKKQGLTLNELGAKNGKFQVLLWDNTNEA